MNIPDIFERGLPSSVEAERTILGAILLDNEAYYEADLISSDDFVLDSHQRLFAAIARLMEERRAVDIVTLGEDLHIRKQAESVGGIAYIASLIEGLPRRLSIDEYVRIVKETSKLRRVITECSLTMVKAAERNLDADELIADSDKRMLEISSDDSSACTTLAQMSSHQFPLLQEEAQQPAPKRIPTGLDVLDRKLATSGWMKGELTVVAARPGKGKSALLIQTLIACGRNNIPALFFSMEMDESQVWRRVLAAMTGIPYALFKKPSKLTPIHWTKIDEARDQLRHFPIRIDSSSRLTASQVVSRGRIAKRRYSIEFLGVDYLQILRFATDKPEARYIAVGDAATQFAALAKDENIAVVALSSLTEKTARGHDALPSMADIRQSGDVQYVAGSVILLHREIEEEEEQTLHQNGIAWRGRIIIGKQRQGEDGKIEVNYMECGRFESRESKPSPQQSLLQIDAKTGKYANA
jgi:replicative DNA helicase